VGLPEPGNINTDTMVNPDGPAQLKAVQMLGQLAVNIVDATDHDDYATPFNWFPNPSGATPAPADAAGNLTPTNANPFWVFGHELPRLVVNEAQVRLENDPAEPDIVTAPAGGADREAKLPYKMRVWAELHNPLTPRDANEVGHLADNGAAMLANAVSGTPYSPYRMRLVKNNAAALTSLLDPANIGGEPPAAELLVPNPAVLNTAPANTVMQVAPNGVPSLPAPAVTGYKNPATGTPAFYIVGPAGDAMGGALPRTPDTTSLPAHGQFDNFEYNVNSTGGSPGLTPAQVIADTAWSPVIVLQRLANEHMLPGPYNPYITVDTFMTGTQTDPGGVTFGAPTPVSIVQDRVQIGPKVGMTSMDRIKTMMVPKWNSIDSFGKRQPLRSYIHMSADDPNYRQQPDEATMDTEMKHTFTRHNGKKADGSDPGNDTLDRPFTAMPHLDRTATSVAELTHVSLFGSHMVMPLFYTGTGQTKMMYQADWLSDKTNLSRAFDLLTTHGRFHGQGHAGRAPGKVNINSLTDKTVLTALADVAHLGGTNGKYYTSADVDRVWAQILAVRQQSSADDLYTGNTRPVLGTVSPYIAPSTDLQYPSGMGSGLTIPGIIRDTVFTGTPFEQERVRQELLETLVPQLTTRSNTFAVYATIGFFEVLNPGTGTDGITYSDTNRPILGSEVIGADGKTVRYKFFSVIDRTQLSFAPAVGNTLQGIGAVHFSYEPNVAAGSPDPQMGSSVTVAIPRTSFSGASGGPTALAQGNYDGIQWRVTVGTNLMLDANPDSGVGDGYINMNSEFLPNTDQVVPPTAPYRNRAEQVTVSRIDNDPTNGRCLLTFTINKPHARGCSMRLNHPDPTTFPFAARLGNPGPQAGSFNLGANTYKTVIPVFERIDGY